MEAAMTRRSTLTRFDRPCWLLAFLFKDCIPTYEVPTMKTAEWLVSGVRGRWSFIEGRRGWRR